MYFSRLSRGVEEKAKNKYKVDATTIQRPYAALRRKRPVATVFASVLRHFRNDNH